MTNIHLRAACSAGVALLLSLVAGIVPATEPSVGVVSHVNVVSDKVPDISSLAAWKRSFLKDEMTEHERAMAAWRTTVMFQHQDDPPREFLHSEAVVQDPLKIFHVYGYSFCSVACSDIAALSRFAGLKVRGWGIHQHSVPEVSWDNQWHLLDASLVNYFPTSTGSIASVEEIMASIKDWYERNPGYQGNAARLREFQQADGWTGWKRGPTLLAQSPLIDAGGFWPAGTHGWSSTMQEYDGTYGPGQKPFLYEYGYSQGYQLNIQLRPGLRLTRNWSNKGLHVNMHDGGAPNCLNEQTGSDALKYTPKFGDLAPGRIGNGTVEYEVPVRSPSYRTHMLSVENLDQREAQVADAGQPGIFILRMPSSYVYLTGTLTFTAAIGEGGAVTVFFSDNNGLDWKKVSQTAASGKHVVDLSSHVLRRYDYRLKFVLTGKASGLSELKIVHDIQHSQRPLPALAKGDNSITFNAGPSEGTIAIEGATNLSAKAKQLVYTDFHPDVQGFEPNLFVGNSGKGSLSFPIETPGAMVRLRFGAHYRARDARDGLDYEVSFDQGQTWKVVDRAAGPTPGNCKYVVFDGIPPGTRTAFVRFTGTSRNATGIFNFRIDADYSEPFGGFRPVKVTYLWDEAGQPKQHVQVLRQPHEKYTINCPSQPTMKSIILELTE